MSESETIEVSSTITRSCGSRLPRSWRKRLWLSGRQPSRRCSVEARRSRSRRGSPGRRPGPRASLVHRLLQPRRGLAGRRGERHERRRRAGGLGLLREQRDDPRDRRRLARAGTAGDDGEAPRHRRAPRASACRPVGSSPNSRSSPTSAAPSSTPPTGAPASAAQIGGDAALLAPVAVEVQRAVDEPQRTAPRGSSSPTATSGLRARRATQSPGSGHGSARHVDVLVLRPPPRCRGRSRGRRGRGPSAARARRARRPARPPGPPPRRARARRCATCTSAALSTPASLNARSSAGARSALSDANGSVSSEAHAAAVQHVAQPAHERCRRPPREHAARRVVDHRRGRPDHPAQEQVQHAREVALGVVARQPPAQEAVQHDGVEQRLQHVVRAAHLGRQHCGAVMPRGELLAGRAEPVRLVVDDREAGSPRRTTRSTLPVR